MESVWECFGSGIQKSCSEGLQEGPSYLMLFEKSIPWLELKGMSLSGNSIGRDSGTLTRKRETLNARLELEVSGSDLLGDSVWDSGSGSILRPNHSFAGFLVCVLCRKFRVRDFGV